MRIIITVDLDRKGNMPQYSESTLCNLRDESGRAARVARSIALAEQTFANRDKAGRWLRRNLSTLGGRTPMELLRTEAGARVVENLLARIAWGAGA